MAIRLIIGDARDKLRELAGESVHCAVSSPPYFGLRDYGVVGQIGLEATPAEYVAAIVDVFREVWRVLRKDGTLWLNLGDSYAGSWDAQSRGSETPGTLQGSSQLSARQIAAHPKGTLTGSLKNTRGLKPKDLIGIPWRVAFALQEDGWWLRQDIIWSKPNPMPESVTDRCTKAHEYLFLLSKSERYYYDAEAVMENFAPASIERLSQPNLENQAGSDRVPGKTNGPMKAVARHLPGNKTHKGTTAYLAGDKRQRTKAGLVDYAARQRGLPPRHAAYPESSDQSGLDEVGRGEGRNKRSVWTVATTPFKEAHFATFPPALIEPCIKAGCPEGGTVLDPFGGAGTTGLVADRLNRAAILIELNPAYGDIARRRIAADAGMFSQITA